MNISRVRKCREAALKRWSAQSFRDKMKKVMTSKKYRRKMSRSTELSFSNPKIRLYRSRTSKRLWGLPGYRRKVTNAVKNATTEQVILKRRISLKNSWTPKRRKEASTRMLKEWRNNYWKRRKKNRLSKRKLADRNRMTNLERSFEVMNKRDNFGFEFTGARKNIAGSRTPDFVDENSKLAIEIYGNQHKNSILEDEERIKEIKRAGWKVLIVWQDDLRFKKSKVVSNVKRFVSKYR